MYKANLLNCLFCGWFVGVGTRAQISILWQTVAKLNRFVVVEIVHFSIECCRVDHNRCANENLISLRPHLSSCFLTVFILQFSWIYMYLDVSKQWLCSYVCMLCVDTEGLASSLWICVTWCSLSVEALPVLYSS